MIVYTMTHKSQQKLADPHAGELLEHLYRVDRAIGKRREAYGTICPKHRRKWYLKSTGMPTGF